MEQIELERKVRELFERQGFEVKKNRNSFTAENNQKLQLKVFSSEEFSIEDVIADVEEGEKVFIDRDLEEIKERIENDVSVLDEQKEDPDYDTPSYEVIGDIAMINDLADVEKNDAVEGILYHNPGLKTILLKKEGLKGEFRVGDYEKLYGEETETVHKEHGCRYKIDVTKAFFSEREGTERERVLDSVENGERILVMFCGVGPYPVILADKKSDVKIVGVEKNPEAVKYAKENVALNNLEDSIDILEGDVRQKVPELGKFDRVLMPSPTNAYEFIDCALSVADKGTELTFYGISEKDNLFDKYIELIRNHAKEKGFEIELQDKRVVSEYSPGKSKMAIDFKVK